MTRLFSKNQHYILKGKAFFAKFRHHIGVKCLITFLIFILLIGGLIIDKYRPFDQEVWGTVSDWVMVAITAITGVFLILTFRSQLGIARLELAKFRYQFLPYMQVKEEGFAIKVTIKMNPIITLKHSTTLEINFNTIILIIVMESEIVMMS